jgi:hypothetical protein
MRGCERQGLVSKMIKAVSGLDDIEAVQGRLHTSSPTMRCPAQADEEIENPASLG